MDLLRASSVTQGLGSCHVSVACSFACLCGTRVTRAHPTDLVSAGGSLTWTTQCCQKRSVGSRPQYVASLPAASYAASKVPTQTGEEHAGENGQDR